MRPRTLISAALTGLAACGQIPAPDLAALVDPAGIQVSRGMGPPGADPGACYGRETTPAVIETVTEQVMIQPPQISSSGQVIEPGVFVTETRQRIVRERRELWFETPCEVQRGDAEFISNLQRALEARGHFRGMITGVMDARTRRAVRSYQASEGLDSAVLSVAAARRLGLLVWDPGLDTGGAGS